MDSCDAIVVGGGPAGSTCAWSLRRSGLDVVVMDAAVFPRDKVCAGWITPQVVAALELDTGAYRQGRTLQPVTGFRVGLIGGADDIETRYGRTVSFGIRRCEFDHFLLERSNVRTRLGTRVTSLRRERGRWMVNDAVSAPVLVGAGGQSCPVAQQLNGPMNAVPLVVAQEAEFPFEAGQATAATNPEVPDLYFCDDLKGYGWCVRKGQYLNVGLGRLDRQSLPAETARFVAFLRARHKLPASGSWRWRGHAYALYQRPRRRVVDEGVVLLGDAAGLAYAQSGEGIRPAVESGLLAATTIVEANADYSKARLDRYEERLRARFGTARLRDGLSRLLPAGLGATLGRQLLSRPAFVRHVVLDRWFLHAEQPALSSS